MMCYQGIYGNGEYLNPNKFFMYFVILKNFSQLFAIYCLVLFYKATYSILSPMRPFGKFLCIKLVVFFTFWQSMVHHVA